MDWRKTYQPPPAQCPALAGGQRTERRRSTARPWELYGLTITYIDVLSLQKRALCSFLSRDFSFPTGLAAATPKDLFFLPLKAVTRGALSSCVHEPSHASRTLHKHWPIDAPHAATLNGRRSHKAAHRQFSLCHKMNNDSIGSGIHDLTNLSTS